MKEFYERNGDMVFAVTENRQFLPYKNRSNREIYKAISDGMQSTAEKLNRKFVEWVQTRTRHTRIRVTAGINDLGSFAAVMQHYDKEAKEWVDAYPVAVFDVNNARLPAGLIINVFDVDIKPGERFSGKDDLRLRRPNG